MLARFSIFPLDKGEEVSREVAKAIDYIIKESKKLEIKYEITSMGTIIEGEPEDVWKILEGSHKEMKKYSNRVYVSIEIDDRKGENSAIINKKKKVDEILKKGR